MSSKQLRSWQVIYPNHAFPLAVNQYSMHILPLVIDMSCLNQNDSREDLMTSLSERASARPANQTPAHQAATDWASRLDIDQPFTPIIESKQ